MSSWWGFIVLAVHLLLGDPLSGRPVEIRLYHASSLAAELTVRFDTQRNVYRIGAHGIEGQTVLEAARLYSQVYTVFPAWEWSTVLGDSFEDGASVAPASVDGTASDDVDPAFSASSAGTAGPRYSSGPYPPRIVDLTPVILQIPSSAFGSRRTPAEESRSGSSADRAFARLAVVWDGGAGNTAPGAATEVSEPQLDLVLYEDSLVMTHTGSLFVLDARLGPRISGVGGSDE